MKILDGKADSLRSMGKIIVATFGQDQKKQLIWKRTQVSVINNFIDYVKRDCEVIGNQFKFDCNKI